MNEKTMKESIFAVMVAIITIVLVVLIFVVPVLAQSLTVTPSPQVSITITTKVPVTFKIDGGFTNSDYVALYVEGSIPYFDWYYVSSGTRIKATAGTTATRKYLNLKPGKYEAKLYIRTNAGVFAFHESKPFVVDLASIESTGPVLTVTRKATNDPDVISIAVENDKGTVNAPKDTKIISK